MDLVRLLADAQLVKQGAEARVYRAPLFVGVDDNSDGPPRLEPCLIKHRFPKQYRHQVLDRQLTKTRVSFECRSLLRAARAGANVPGIKAVDAENGVVAVDWIDGRTVREVLGGEPDDEDEADEVDDSEVEDPLQGLDVTRDRLLELVGEQIALLHLSDIIHGDLTTSNLMLRPSPSPAVYVIDFGLSYVSAVAEDKAVDLYVLERAVEATHPEPKEVIKRGHGLYKGIERAYADRLGPKEWEKVERKLKEVRMRGRKRSMVG